MNSTRAVASSLSLLLVIMVVVVVALAASLAQCAPSSRAQQSSSYSKNNSLFQNRSPKKEAANNSSSSSSDQLKSTKSSTSIAPAAAVVVIDNNHIDNNINDGESEFDEDNDESQHSTSHNQHQSQGNRTSRRVRVRGERQHYCGGVLKDVLRLVCDGRYNGPNLKRSVSARISDIPQLLTVLNSSSPALASSEEGFFAALEQIHQHTNELMEKAATNPEVLTTTMASVISARNGRSSRGIVEECCRNPCSLRDLELYCLNQRTTA